MTTRNSVGRESSKPCFQMLISVHESGKRMKLRHVQSLMRNPNVKEVRFAQHTTVLVSPAASTSHTVSAFVAHGGSSSSDSCGANNLQLLNTCDLLTVTSTLVQRS